jgi:hypothetical protein
LFYVCSCPKPVVFRADFVRVGNLQHQQSSKQHDITLKCFLLSLCISPNHNTQLVLQQNMARCISSHSTYKIHSYEIICTFRDSQLKVLFFNSIDDSLTCLQTCKKIPTFLGKFTLP